jgi:nicotinate-nucleotide pyrophosphorylase
MQFNQRIRRGLLLSENDFRLALTELALKQVKAEVKKQVKVEVEVSKNQG